MYNMPCVSLFLLYSILVIGVNQLKWGIPSFMVLILIAAINESVKLIKNKLHTILLKLFFDGCSGKKGYI